MPKLSTAGSQCFRKTTKTKRTNKASSLINQIFRAAAKFCIHLPTADVTMLLFL
jgi:hypothetical protein